MKITDIVPHIGLSSCKGNDLNSSRYREIIIGPNTEIELKSGYDYSLDFKNGANGDYLHNHIQLVFIECYKDIKVPLEGLLDSDYLRKNYLNKIKIAETHYKKDKSGSIKFHLIDSFVSKNLDDLFEILEVSLAAIDELLTYDKMFKNIKSNIANVLAKKICESDPEKHGYLEF